MGVNKVIYGSNVLIDLTADTITEADVLEGKTAHGKDGEAIVGECTFDVDSGDATIAAAEALTGKTLYARGGKITGSMPNRGQAVGSISTKNGTYAIQAGYHDGSGSVGIAAVEKAKIIPSNIRQGITLLGEVGTMTGLEDVDSQAKTVTPAITQQVVLPDEGYNYLTQVTVNAIPYVETPNAAGGTTVTIAS